MKDDDLLKEARKRFRIAYEAEASNRELALDDINFRHGDQWEEGARQKRVREERPILTVNKLEQRVDQVTGDQRMNRMGVIVRPLDVTESNGRFNQAEVITGIIKNIEAVSNAKTAYDTAFDHAVGHGFGYWRLITKYNDDDSFDQDIRIKRINNSMRVYLDPSAEEVTKKDAMWGFITQMVDEDDYPGADWEMNRGEERQLWEEGDKVRIAEYFRRVPMKAILWLMGGKVVRVKDDTMDIRDELKESGAEPEKERTVDTYKVEWYKLGCTEVFKRGDFPSKYIPIIPCYGKELNVRGKTYYRGVIRYAKDAQRIYNYTRTASVEQTALAPKAPWVMEEGQLGSHKKDWETANTKNLSVLVYKHVPGVPKPERQPPPQPSSGWLTESGIADQDIDASSGMYKASLGAPSNERSGKAINARKIEGDVGTYHFHDNRALSLQHSYEVLVDMIPRVYDTKRIVRIKTPEDQEEMVTVNNAIFDDESNKWVNVYDLSVGKYEIAIDVGASYTTQRQQASESMMELIQYAPSLAPRILDLIAKNLDWPGADDIAARLQDKRPTQEQMQQAVMQAVQEALNNENLKVDKYKARTDRIKAIGDIEDKGDKISVELLKLLAEEDIRDEEILVRATEIIRQAGEIETPIEPVAQPQNPPPVQ